MKKEPTTMNTKTKDAITTLKETAPLPVEQPGTALQVVDFGDDAGMGMEDVDKSEFKVPFLRILQPLSPQVKPLAEGGIPGAQASMIFDTGSGRFWDGKEGLEFIPVHRDHNYVEYIPRNLGGGFVGIHAVDDPLVLELRAKQGRFGRLSTTTKRDNNGLPLDGTEVSETFYLYGLSIDKDGFAQRVIVPFVSTQIRKYQSFMSRQMSIKYVNPRSTDEAPLPPVQPPLWAHRWRLTTIFEKNKKGEFYGWVLTLAAKKPDGTEEPPTKSLIPRSDPLYAEGRSFYDLLQEGKAKADYTKAEGAIEEVPF
jgi:hypothetical protein